MIKVYAEAFAIYTPQHVATISTVMHLILLATTQADNHSTFQVGLSNDAWFPRHHFACAAVAVPWLGRLIKFQPFA